MDRNKGMVYMVRSYGTSRSRFGAVIVLLVLLLSASSCTKSQKTAAAPAEQRTFATQEDAGAALLAAAKSGDERALIAIFGPDSKVGLLSGDAATDQASLQGFVTSYNEMHRWGAIKAGGQVLQVGADNQVFPIPLDRNSSGRWFFDTAAGKDEVLARRIGKNELIAMDACTAIADAQHRYHEKSHEYAQKLISDPGKQNGLYWAAAPGQPTSPLGELDALTEVLRSATAVDKPPLFNGYYYRILTSGDNANGKLAKGFTVLAYPAEYRNSGIMSFLVGENGTLYQKDLGERTSDTATTMTRVDPRDGWIRTVSGSNTASRTQP